MKTSLDELAPDFERATGNKLSFSFGPSARIAKMVADGEANDVAIVTDQGLEDLTRQGKLVPGIARRHRALGHGARGAEGRAEARHLVGRRNSRRRCWRRNRSA